MIELLVVIAVLSLLMALLVPALHRVRKQARADGVHPSDWPEWMRRFKDF